MGVIKDIIDKQYRNRLFSSRDMCENKTDKKEFLKLRDSGFIKLVKGRRNDLYYVPQKTSLGNFPPREKYILEDYIEKYKGYLSGNYLYNKWGLTTQVPREIKIVSLNITYTKKVKVFNLDLKIVPSKVNVRFYNEENIKCFQYLDALNVSKIIDPVDNVLDILKKRIEGLDQKKLMRLSDRYYPFRISVLLESIISGLL